MQLAAVHFTEKPVVILDEDELSNIITKRIECCLNEIKRRYSDFPSVKLNDFHYMINGPEDEVAHTNTKGNMFIDVIHILSENDSELMDTIIHEVGHKILGKGHNKKWKEWMIKYGGRPTLR